MKTPYRRNRAGVTPLVEIQKEAHKIAFYPLLFQAVRCLSSFGFLEEMGNSGTEGMTEKALGTTSGLSSYARGLLLELAEVMELVEHRDGRFYLTRLGSFLATDASVQINVNFSHHLCYQGAFALEDALLKGTPEGLKHFGDWPTIYEGLTQLPEQAQKSWFDFDNHYSDLLFDKAVQIVLQGSPQRIFDLGGNTGKFDATLLLADSTVTVTLLDLPPQLELARKTLHNIGLEHRATFHPINVLEADTPLPDGADAIWMSQFLDCFTEDQIVSILNKVRVASSPHTKIFILEPFVDSQHSGTRLALLAISLYFACMANGNSRFYRQTDMERMLAMSGLGVDKIHAGIGPFNYTLLECSINQ